MEVSNLGGFTIYIYLYIYFINLNRNHKNAYRGWIKETVCVIYCKKLKQIQKNIALQAIKTILGLNICVSEIV